jgi:hypothetical protein
MPHSPTTFSRAPAAFLLALGLLCACGDEAEPVSEAAPPPPARTDAPAGPAESPPAQTPEVDEAAPEPVVEEVPVEKDPYQDQFARFIAGLEQVDTDSPFLEYQATPSWKKHQETIQKHWDHHEENRLAPMRTWQANELSNMIRPEINLLYPLSGPDFLHADVLYPEAPRYIMMGLEKIASLPQLETLSSARIDAYLEGVDQSLRDIYTKGYFITQHMRGDLRASGLSPIVMVFLVRTGHEVLTIKKQSLNKEGQLIPVENWESDQVHAMQIYFRDRESQQVKDLVYFDLDVRDDSLEKNPEFVQFIEELTPMNSFVKAGSYVLCCRHTSTMRETILRVTESLFQDDTGIPYRALELKDWNLQLFGEYAWPTEDFSPYTRQPELMALYKATDASQIKTLPFLMGYHYFGARKQNHMLLRRTAATAGPG